VKIVTYNYCMSESIRHRSEERQAAARLLACVRALVRRFALGERADVSCCGMTVAQSATLEALLEGPLRMGALCRRLGITPSTLTRNLSRLEQRGLVTRLPDPADRRAGQVALTAAGEAAAAEVAGEELTFAGDVLARLPPGSADRVVTALEELLGAVRAATESCCPGAFDHLMRTAPWTGAKGDDHDDQDNQLLRERTGELPARVCRPARGDGA
jgi:DNA-binding MarR family transcriptional regulator